MSPASRRIMSQPAATATTAAGCALVPSTSSSRSLRNSSQSNAVPIRPPAGPVPALTANCPSWLPGPLCVLAVTAARMPRRAASAGLTSLVRVDVAGQCARDEAGRQQDERGNAHFAGQHLRADREDENQADTGSGSGLSSRQPPVGG
jgi:hypothetical protein